LLRLFEGPQCFFAFSPNLLSISPGEKCARSSRTRNRTPAGVGFSLDRVFVEGSAASIAAGFISAASAEVVTPASTRPMTMHPEGRMQPALRWRRRIRFEPLSSSKRGYRCSAALVTGFRYAAMISRRAVPRSAAV
jgi:hypothetical protein